MDKRAIRAEMKRRRLELTPMERAHASSIICAKLCHASPIKAALGSRAGIAVYLANRDEVDIGGFVDWALNEGGELYAPRWNGETYVLAPLKSRNALVVGPHDILEPPANDDVIKSPAVWLVPGLAFTENGDRLGYGGGWYDRLLSAVSTDAIKLGIGYSFQVVANLPHEEHDIKLNAIITEEA